MDKKILKYFKGRSTLHQGLVKGWLRVKEDLLNHTFTPYILIHVVLININKHEKD